MRLMITGGAGFIGSALVRYVLEHTTATVLNVDKLTYAGNLESLPGTVGEPRYTFAQVDICDRPSIDRLFAEHRPDAVIHLAAESHVDRSIDGPSAFMQTNIIGTYTLLEAARGYWSGLGSEARSAFRFHHVSTDEVYGDLEKDDAPFTEVHPYQPSSPYSASKASSDHLVRAWQRTYGLPVSVSNTSNNYGPYQFPEKLIPLVTLNALEGKRLPVYGKGDQIRDWLFVEDHVRALYLVATRGRAGETYNIGGRSERRNIDVVRGICELLEEMAPTKPAGLARYDDLIAFVQDRPGHDKRYAIDNRKIESTLGWTPIETFDTGLRKTIRWYLDNRAWCSRVQDGSYQRERLGTRIHV